MRGRPRHAVGSEPDAIGRSPDVAMAATVQAAEEMRVVEPEHHQLAREVALSRLKQDMFEHGEPVKLGRYHLLKIVGKGGMGVVWGAWDPELDRRVAIKLVKPTVRSAREQILLEGQALAKLSHPNIVPVYDVGIVDEQVYLVMEWICGRSLRAFANERRSIREIVAVYRQAAEGLAAAHRAGLVHRDFKPDNAIRGDDGRVRVLDFGLAHSRSSDQGDTPSTLGGTPGYMAPEQMAGGPLSPATDQYAFCVSLRQALQRRHADGRVAQLPGWIATVVARGTHDDPAARHGSMLELVRALDRDPRRIWRNRIAAGIAGFSIAAAFVAGKSAESTIDPCSGAEGAIGSVWNAPARAAVSSHLGELGAFARGEAASLTRDIDAYSATWSRTYRNACLANRRGELTPQLYDGRLQCLARSRSALGATVDLLRTVPIDRFDNAVVAARSLPDLSGCADLDGARIAPPPASTAARVEMVADAVERVRVHVVAGHPDAEASARRLVRDAEVTGYAPLIARALLVRGRAAMALDHSGAEQPLARAVTHAIAAGDDETAIEAFARLVYVTAPTGKLVDGLTMIEALASRSGAVGGRARALLYNNLATRHMVHGDRVAARELLLRARAELPADPAHVDIELVCIDQNLALLAIDAAEREAAFGKAADTLERALGPHHPNTLTARLAEALGTREDVLARSRLAATCETYRRVRPDLGSAITYCEYELAWLADAAGDLDAAGAAMTIAAADPQRSKLGDIATAYLARSPDSTDAIRDAASVLARSSDLWSVQLAVDSYIVAAIGYDRRGDPRALAAWSAALVLLERASFAAFERRLVRVRAAVARHRAP